MIDQTAQPPDQPIDSQPAQEQPASLEDQPPQVSTSPTEPQPPVQLPAEKKGLPKKLLIFLIVLLFLSGSAGLLQMSGILKSISSKFLGKGSVSQPGEESVSIGGAEEAGETVAPGEETTVTDQELPKDKYLKDADNDGFPDFLELGTGYDPNVVDCAREANCQAAVGMNPRSENNVLFILDSSGSMAGQVGGQQKMVIAKQAVNRYIDRVPASFNAGLMVYGHQGSNSASEKAVSCAGIETFYPLGTVDKEAFKQKAASFQATGWTPIADSLQKAQNEVFAGKEKDNNAIILISDGIETCGGDPCGVARELKSLGISPVIDVIGFDVDAQARAQLECVARVTNGQYFDARTAEEFNQAFDQFAQRAEEFEGVANCLNENFEFFAVCMDEQVLASMEYLDKEKIAALDAGDQERVAELDKIAARLNQKYEDFLTGFEEEYTSGLEDLLEEYEEDLGEEFNIDEILTP